MTPHVGNRMTRSDRLIQKYRNQIHEAMQAAALGMVTSYNMIGWLPLFSIEVLYPDLMKHIKSPPVIMAIGSILNSDQKNLLRSAGIEFTSERSEVYFFTFLVGMEVAARYFAELYDVEKQISHTLKRFRDIKEISKLGDFSKEINEGNDEINNVFTVDFRKKEDRDDEKWDDLFESLETGTYYLCLRDKKLPFVKSFYMSGEVPDSTLIDKFFIERSMDAPIPEISDHESKIWKLIENTASEFHLKFRKKYPRFGGSGSAAGGGFPDPYGLYDYPYDAADNNYEDRLVEITKVAQKSLRKANN